MPAKKKTESKKSISPQKKLHKITSSIKARVNNLLQRRPHRSFRLTRRRDYKRSFAMPGYWKFTGDVRRMLWNNKKLFLLVALVYAVMTAALVGMASQDTYTQLQESLDSTSNAVLEGNFGEISKAGLLLASGALGVLQQTPTDTQRIFAAFLGIFVWLTTIWLLRAIMAGKKPTLRDGLYNAGAPIVPTILVSSVAILQLLPIALAAIGFGAASTTGALNGIEAMVFWVAAGLLALVSLYWIAGTIVALVVITLPGMSPMRAIRSAGDLVVGRRIRFLLRLLWSALLLLAIWVIVMVPIILFDSWLKDKLPQVDWLPIVPVMLLVMLSLSVIWTGTYAYMLYRKMVDDDASPA